MTERTFDIVVNNIPLRLLVAELDKQPSAKSGELFTELNPVLQDLFTKKNLRDAVEFVTPARPLVVKVLTEKQMRTKKKTYNPTSVVYDTMESVAGVSPPTWWKNGTDLPLPKLAEVFAQPITVRFRRTGTLDLGITEEQEKEVAKSIVSGPEEEEEEEETREAPPPPAPIPRGPECDKVLAEAGITSRRDFLRWALTNHPDKGGDTAKFQRVSACVDTQYGSGRKTRRRRVKRRTTRKSKKSSSSGRA